MEKEIVWTETALNQLEDIYFFMLDKTQSITLAEKIVETIYKSVEILKFKSEIYEQDEMKKCNDGNFRAFEVYSYRISYKIEKDKLFIVRVRHTSRNPKTF